jgi:AcrR family transcriptional regulator
MNGKLEHIIQKARSIFMRCGIRSVTMDDVCKEMRISKKTLYQYVNDKTDLVNQTMRSEIEKDEEEITRLINAGHNAIDEMFEITLLVAKKVKDIHPSILFDMQKYYPEAWEMMRMHRNDFIERVIKLNIAKGQTEGNYRINFHPAIVARLFSSKIDVLSDNQFIQDSGCSLMQINSEHLTYHLHGIVTPKGNRYLENKLSNLNSTTL